MEYTRKYKARESLFPILKTILEKNEIDYVTVIDDGQRYVLTNISGSSFRRYVEDSLCIEQQGDSPIPVLPYRVMKNPALREKVILKCGVKSCNVLKKDLNRVIDKIWSKKDKSMG